jgi:hypothetical protein
MGVATYCPLRPECEIHWLQRPLGRETHRIRCSSQCYHGAVAGEHLRLGVRFGW